MATDDTTRNGEPAALKSNLADLLDKFTSEIEDPEANTIGAFSDTIQALHAEFALLARHFEAIAGHTASSYGQEPPLACQQSGEVEPANLPAQLTFEG